MKKHVFFHRLLIFVLSVAMIFTLVSCAQQKKPVPKATKSEEEQNKPPKELDELSKAVEKIEKTLLEMHEKGKMPLFMQQEEIKKQEEKQKKEEEQQGGGGGGEQGAAIVRVAKPGDIVITLGAGSIGTVPDRLVEALTP